MEAANENYKPTEHGGKKEDGQPDQRVNSEHGFGGESGPDPHVEGKKGGKTSDLSAEAQRPASDGEAFNPDEPKV